MKVIDGMDFLSDIALAFIAFSTGEFFSLFCAKEKWLESSCDHGHGSSAGVCMRLCSGLWRAPLKSGISIVLGSFGISHGAASTIMTIRQTGAKGDFVDTLLQVVALDDVVGLIEYSAAISIALAALSGTGGFQMGNILKPIIINGAVLVLGGIFWLAVKMPYAKEKIQRQPPDHICGSIVCFLRNLFSGGCITSSWMYVHGNHLY